MSSTEMKSYLSLIPISAKVRKKQLTEKLSDALDALLHRSADTTEK